MNRVEEFVDVWMDAYQFGQSQRWVAAQLNIAPTTVARRAAKLQKKGVKLPPLKYAKYVNADVDRLNAIVNERLGKT